MRSTLAVKKHSSLVRCRDSPGEYYSSSHSSKFVSFTGLMDHWDTEVLISPGRNPPQSHAPPRQADDGASCSSAGLISAQHNRHHLQLLSTGTITFSGSTAMNESDCGRAPSGCRQHKSYRWLIKLSRVAYRTCRFPTPTWAAGCN